MNMCGAILVTTSASSADDIETIEETIETRPPVGEYICYHLELEKPEPSYQLTTKVENAVSNSSTMMKRTVVSYPAIGSTI